MKSTWGLTAVSVSPCGSGMSVAANRLVMEQVAAGGGVSVFDKESSMEQLYEDIQKAKQEHTIRMLRIGRKRNDGPVATLKTEPY